MNESAIRAKVKEVTCGVLPKFTPDGYGGYHHVMIDTGLTLMKTDNANYAGGFSNGYGKGVYAIVHLVGMQTAIKIK